MPAQAFDDPDTSPRPPAANALRRMRPLLGTYVEIALHGPQPGGALTIERAIERAFAAVAQAQRLWSFQDPDSELTRLNRHPWQRVPISPATGRLLRLARALAQLSEGRFNPTLGGRLVAQGALPDHGGPAALPIGNADDLELGVGWARLNRPVRLTLDGIAKGYAVDQAVRLLRGAGVRAGWVNAGGDLRVFGDVTVPVRRREADGRLQPLGALRNGAIATSVSGPTVELGGAFPGRLLGPRGQPAAPGTWTVLAPRAWRADALTKVAANCLAEERAAWIERLGGRLVEQPHSAGTAAPTAVPTAMVRPPEIVLP